MKKKMIVLFFVLCVVAIAIPSIFSIANLNVGIIIYESCCPGIVLNGELKQYGNINSKAKTIEVSVDANFVFMGWDDGTTTTARNDVFTKKTKHFKALGRYKNNELDILSFSKKIDDITYNSILDDKVCVYHKNESQISINKCGISSIINFENLKGQSRRDYFVSFEEPPFLDSNAKKWSLFSLHNDGSLVHNLFAYNLLNEKNENNRDFRIINLVFEKKYNGLYLAVEDVEYYLSRINADEFKWEASLTNYLNSDRLDYNNELGIAIINKGKKEKTDAIISDILNGITNFNSDFWDKKSLDDFLAINELLKDNSKSEADIRIYKCGGTLYFDNYSSYSLSSPSFKWSDTKSEGKTNVNRILLNYANDASNKERINESVNDLLIDSSDCLYNSILTIQTPSESTEQTWGLFGNYNKFGLPDDMKNFTSNSQYIDHYKLWVDQRIEWLSSNLENL